MAERNAHARPEPIEPVSFAARLVRAPDVAYTEVAGTPVVVAIEAQAVQPLTPAWAFAWAALDGRPVSEALDIDPATLDAVAARNVIEVLRRLKAAGLVCDAGSLGASRPSGPVVEQAVSGELVLELHGRAVEAASGPGLVLELEPSNPDTVLLSVRDGDAGVAVSIGGEPVLRVEVPATIPEGPVDAVARLHGIVVSVAEPAVLSAPGAIDLIAAVAELATTQPIPDAGS